jgi:riboflavin kinase/FMN adenylyltransferase
MQHYHSLEAVSLTDSWLTIGVFDGVHLGHQEIIRQLTAGAHANGAPAVVLTFFPHPALVLTGAEPKWLTTPDERAEILAGLGVDAVITHPFDKNIAALGPEEFMAQVKQHLGLHTLLAGYDFALGRHRSGNLARLTEIGEQMGFTVLPLAAIKRDGQIISSTLIRQQLSDGDVTGAAAKLGRNYTLSGPVIHGFARGRTIGIPTANLDTPLEKVMPSNGVYACCAWIDTERHKAVVNIGVQPTFASNEAIPRVEAHLLDFDADLYGQTLKLEFVEHLRSEQKFSGIDALVAQIRSWTSRKANEIL